MKQIAALLFLLVAGINLIAQDSTKTTDTAKKFHERLSEVTVTARRPLMIQEVDKTVVDVKNFVSGAALNTMELLERIPGVTVNGTGDISLNGRGGALVLIDGRTTYMSAQDLVAYLKSIPAANLDKI
jgi:outer membrane cobalamin receptor